MNDPGASAAPEEKEEEEEEDVVNITNNAYNALPIPWGRPPPTHTEILGNYRVPLKPLVATEATMVGFRAPPSEDASKMMDIPELKMNLLSIFDGHGGDLISKEAAKQFPKLLVENITATATAAGVDVEKLGDDDDIFEILEKENVNVVDEVLKKTFEKLDENITKIYFESSDEWVKDENGTTNQVAWHGSLKFDFGIHMIRKQMQETAKNPETLGWGKYTPVRIGGPERAESMRAKLTSLQIRSENWNDLENIIKQQEIKELQRRAAMEEEEEEEEEEHWRPTGAESDGAQGGEETSGGRAERAEGGGDGNDGTTPPEPPTAYKNRAKVMDYLGNQYKSRPSDPPNNIPIVGTTALVVLITKKKFIVAHLGDSRFILSSNTESVSHATNDHKPEDDEESERVKKAGGRTGVDGRIYVPAIKRGVAVSRALGDMAFKMQKNKPVDGVLPMSSLKPGELLPVDMQPVSCVPTIKEIKREPNHRFIFLACDGIFEVFDKKGGGDQVVNKVMSYIPENISDYTGEDLTSLQETITTEILKECLTKGASGISDNMSAMLVLFPEAWRERTIHASVRFIMNSEKERGWREEEVLNWLQYLNDNRERNYPDGARDDIIKKLNDLKKPGTDENTSLGSVLLNLGLMPKDSMIQAGVNAYGEPLWSTTNLHTDIVKLMGGWPSWDNNDVIEWIGKDSPYLTELTTTKGGKFSLLEYLKTTKFTGKDILHSSENLRAKMKWLDIGAGHDKWINMPSGVKARFVKLIDDLKISKGGVITPAGVDAGGRIDQGSHPAYPAAARARVSLADLPYITKEQYKGERQKNGLFRVAASLAPDEAPDEAAAQAAAQAAAEAATHNQTYNPRTWYDQSYMDRAKLDAAKERAAKDPNAKLTSKAAAGGSKKSRTRTINKPKRKSRKPKRKTKAHKKSRKPKPKRKTNKQKRKTKANKRRKRTRTRRR